MAVLAPDSSIIKLKSKIYFNGLMLSFK
ncbi:hypothetical protein CGLO_13748 [Colletotrichum gloeosporioides Cg-14]|uniref:Uncharacterized protein n=1 Tax=Colletotrichum gloeosporioides (strain Cg-14) TaxID=1237896 RepID=T0JVV8_COLGC|nr:hypothetical protein CGLO_13748 [Colletotrichum gloeosporioides Cg-14]